MFGLVEKRWRKPVEKNIKYQISNQEKPRIPISTDENKIFKG